MANRPIIKIPTLEEIDQYQQPEVVTPAFKKQRRDKAASSIPTTGESTECIKFDNLAERDENTEKSDSLNKEKEILIAQPVKATKSSTTILVNSRQQGNPILKHIRNVPWEFADIIPDYELGKTTCALFLSVRYHVQKPDYIHGRLKDLGKSYSLRVILLLIDSKDSNNTVKELAKICILADCTLILAFSNEEAGRYLETYKVYENKPPEVLMEKVDDSFTSKFVDCLTTVKSLNKTNCFTLLNTFGSIKNISEATADEISLCPGFGPQKANRLHGIFHEPFLRIPTNLPAKQSSGRDGH